MIAMMDYDLAGFIMAIIKIMLISGSDNNKKLKKTMNTNVNNAYKYSDITSKVIGCAMKVHNILGNGFQEVIYQRALAIEMKQKHIAFEREKEMPIYYKGFKIGSRRVDFMVEEKIIVEIKAINQLENIHLAQAINYLEAYNLEIGLLINFGNTKLEFRRLINQYKRRRQNRW